MIKINMYYKDFKKKMFSIDISEKDLFERSLFETLNNNLYLFQEALDLTVNNLKKNSLKINSVSIKKSTVERLRNLKHYNGNYLWCYPHDITYDTFFGIKFTERNITKTDEINILFNK